MKKTKYIPLITLVMEKDNNNIIDNIKIFLTYIGYIYTTP